MSLEKHAFGEFFSKFKKENSSISPEAAETLFKKMIKNGEEYFQIKNIKTSPYITENSNPAIQIMGSHRFSDKGELGWLAKKLEENDLLLIYDPSKSAKSAKSQPVLYADIEVGITKNEVVIGPQQLENIHSFKRDILAIKSNKVTLDDWLKTLTPLD